MDQEGGEGTILGNQKDFQICSGSLLTLPRSMMGDSLNRVFKRYIVQNFHSRREIQAITRNHF